MRCYFHHFQQFAYAGTPDCTRILILETPCRAHKDCWRKDLKGGVWFEFTLMSVQTVHDEVMEIWLTSRLSCQ